MNLTSFLTAALLATSLLLSSCGGKDKKDSGDKDTAATTNTSTEDSDDMVPDIDTAALKDEASILDAMQKVADARIADEKKQKDNPNYSGHYLELMKLYTAVLKASTAYSQTITDPARAVEFGKKLRVIQDKMYAK